MNSHNPTRFRQDIQGLRAVAVTLVLVYHIWPEFLSGGYIGVDVFFVISGYLITGLLIREIESTGRISISRFYGRRIRRLLPAASVVLITVIIASFLWLPVTRLEDTAWEVLASALYVENWLLAAWSVDYLAEGSSASPVQHYWTLSVEEQFYIVWPWLILFAGVIATRWRLQRSTALWTLVLGVGVLSFIHSVMATASNQVVAFFMTTTRVWELALGAVLALSVQHIQIPKSLKPWVALTGLIAILTAAIWYSDATPFPGYTALLPTLGTALVILAGSSQNSTSIDLALASRPFQYIGNVSYTLYLWHWPVIVFYAILVNSSPGFVEGLFIIALSLALTQVTYKYVEAPFHRPQTKHGSEKGAYKLAGVCIGACIVASMSAYGYVEYLKQDNPQITDFQSYPGARVFLSDKHAEPGQTLPPLPNPLNAQDDRAQVYDDGCRTSQTDVEARACSYGNPDGSFHVVLAGDSYAVHWLPALEQYAIDRNWRITVFNKSACVFADVVLERWGRDYHECVEWNKRAMAKIVALNPDLFLTGQLPAHEVHKIDGEDERVDALVEGYKKHWLTLSSKGIPVLAIRETPRMDFDGPECVATHSDYASVCRTKRLDALDFTSTFERAVKEVPTAELIDLNDVFCGEEYCDAIIGNILVYRDRGHMTATFVRSMAPILGAKINDWLENRQTLPPQRHAD